MPILRQLEKIALCIMSLKGGDNMTDFLREELNKITDNMERKLIYAIVIDRLNQYKKQGIIDDTLYESLEKAIRRKYKIKKSN